MSSKHTVKLVNAFVPSAYDLNVDVDLSTWSYKAQERVVLARCPDVPHNDIIELHAAPSMEIVSVDGATLLTRDDISHTLHLQLNTTEADTRVVNFVFNHSIQTELRGFYRVRFTHDGKEHRMASTHFEPTSARLFYICQDEPACRADFTLSVSLPKSELHYTVLSNGPVIEKVLIGERIVHRFQTVPRCPSYLTACVVGELEHISTFVGKTKISVYTSPGKIDRASFALKTTAFATEYFEKFFQCPFPLPKLDVVAVPDFPIGGMENWGCITCVESILVDPTTSSIGARKGASELLCHEVSHNWFGNLVAINWWEGLWLKEGFASWCGNHASHVMEPTWGCLDDAYQSVDAAMETDMYEHSHPVEVPINDPTDITQIFDSISYDKGMGLVFMLEAYLGDKLWGPSVAHYINKYKYRDTKTPQLWEALEESAKLPVMDTMASFTSQMGYPLLCVSRPAANKVVLSQRPCHFGSSPSTSDSVWCVPIVIQDQSGDHRCTTTLQGKDEQEVELPDALADANWLTTNPHRTGFYRCRYDDAMFAAWLKVYPQLSPADRRTIISDTFAAVYAGFVEDQSRLPALAATVRASETTMSVLREFFKCIRTYTGSFAHKEEKQKARAVQLQFIVQMASEKMTAVAASAEEDIRNHFLINSALLHLIDSVPASEAAKHPLVAWAVGQAAAFLSGTDYVSGTLNRCLVTYSRFGEDDAHFKDTTLLTKFKEVDGNDEICRALVSAMCMSPNVDFVKWIALQCINGESVRSHYGGQVFAAMAANPSFGTGDVWNFFTEHFDAVNRQWGGGQFRIQVIVKVVGSTLSGAAAAQSFEDFFQSHPLPNARLEIGRSTENIRFRAWLEEQVTAPRSLM